MCLQKVRRVTPGGFVALKSFYVAELIQYFEVPGTFAGVFVWVWG